MRRSDVRSKLGGRLSLLIHSSGSHTPLSLPSLLSSSLLFFRLSLSVGQHIMAASGVSDAPSASDCVIPKAVIKRTMKLDDSVSKVSAEAVAAITKATELFLETFASTAAQSTVEADRKTVYYEDLLEAKRKDVQHNQDWQFLKGTIEPQRTG